MGWNSRRKELKTSLLLVDSLVLPQLSEIAPVNQPAKQKLGLGPKLIHLFGKEIHENNFQITLTRVTYFWLLIVFESFYLVSICVSNSAYECVLFLYFGF